MIGIVVVSHSRALARAAVDLAMEMVEDHHRPRLEVAAGLDEDTFGTDASAVAEAIERVDSSDGVLVLLDLGSAVMSADMATELLDPQVAERVRVSSAPLVEGLVAAVVTAAAGADLDQVHREAARGLDAKAEQVGDVHLSPGSSQAGAGESEAPGEELGSDAPTREVRVEIPHGLHARPAARFVGCANSFPGAEVVVRNADSGSGFVNAASLSAVATLNVKQGQRIVLRASGEEAESALDALEELARAGFGDDPAAAHSAARPRPDAEEPLVMGSGLEVAMGPVRLGDGHADPADYVGSGEGATERRRLEQALDSAEEELRELSASTRSRFGAQQADVFSAHAAWVRDPEITEPAFGCADQGRPAATCWMNAATDAAQALAALDDPYLRERAEDVRSVAQRVVRLLVQPARASEPGEEAGASPGEDLAGEQSGYILLVPELDPETAVGLDPRQVQGVLTTAGGSTGHGVLLAQARGIPTTTGRPEHADLAPGVWLAFDARTGQVWVDPDEEVRGQVEELTRKRRREQERERDAALEPGQTLDGTLVPVLANLSSRSEAAQAIELGAQGAGLVRTEVLFASWGALPTVEEQATELEALAQALDGRPMTVRTWDVGADKPLSFWAQPPEQNPFLGVRGIRSFADQPGVLSDQLRAVCRVAQRHPTRVMFPMVATVGEVQWALELLDAAAQQEGGARPRALEVGIMVEVPAAALKVASLAKGLDFVSVGTNDLTQYTVAAERGHAAVEHLFDPLDPAVLRLVQVVCREAPDGVEVGVCGGAASDPAAACLLVGLGVDDLSATAVAVPRVKAALRRHRASELEELANRALACAQASEVRSLLHDLDGSEVSAHPGYGTGC